MGILTRLSKHFFYLLSFFQILYIRLLSDNKKFQKRRNEVLIIKTDRIGDLILTLKPIYSIKSIPGFDSAKVSILINRISKDLLKRDYFENIECLDPKEFVRSFRYKRNLFNFCRSFDFIISPTHSRNFDLDLINFLIPAKNKIGSLGDTGNSHIVYKSIGDRFYTRLIDCGPVSINEMSKHTSFMRGLGHRNYVSGFADLSYISEGKKIELKKDEKYYILSPGASNLGRQWPSHKMAELSELIFRNTGLVGIIVGTQNEEYLALEIISNSKAELINHTGRYSLRELGVIISKAEFLIGNDSAGVHLANSLKVKSIAITGGGHFKRFLPYDESVSDYNEVNVVYKEMDCYYCNWICKYDKKNENYPCISNISVVDVYNKVEKILT